MFKWLSNLFQKREITRDTHAFLFPEPTWTGAEINDRVAYNLSCYTQGLEVYGDTLSSLSLKCFSHSDKSEVDHPYADLFREPNDEYSGDQLIKCCEQLRWHKGNAFIEIVRDGTGTARELYNLEPWLMQILFDSNGQLYYLWAGSVRYDPDEIIHLKGKSHGDPYLGHGLLEVARQDLGIAIAQDKFTGRYFKNGCLVSGHYTYPTIMTDDVYDDFMDKLGRHAHGVDNAGKAPILENGMDFTPHQISPADSQLLEQRKWQVTQWARWFNLPPDKLCEYAEMKWANVEHAQISFVMNSIRPACIKWEREINKKLWNDTEKKMFYLEFNLDSLLRGDSTTRMNYLTMAVQNNIMTVNEARDLLNKPAVEWGDTPAKTQPTDDDGTPEPFTGYNLPVAPVVAPAVLGDPSGN